MEKEKLWARIVASIHGLEHNGWDTGIRARITSNSPWKAIHDLLPVFSPNIRYDLNSGNSIKFWEQTWVGSAPLKDQFPSLYAFSDLKNELISSFTTPSSSTSGIGWNLGLRRDLRDSDFDCISSLLAILDNVVLDPTRADSRIWTPSPNGIFTCASFFKVLSQSTSPTFPPFPVDEVWCRAIPPRVGSFCWEAYLERINTGDLLQKKRPNTCLSPQWCVLCKADGETGFHLMVSCHFARSLWDWAFSLFGCSWNPPSDMQGLFAPSFRWRLKRVRTMWRGLRAAVCWTLWEERNSRIFSEIQRGAADLKAIIHIRAVQWLKYLKLFTDYTVDDMLRKWGEIANCTQTKLVMKVVWTLPPRGFLKLNVDGCSRGNPGQSGIGGVFRDENGVISVMFSGPIGVGDSLRAEIFAVMEGVRKAKELNIKKLIIEGDSEVVIGWLTKDQNGLWKYNNERRKFKWLVREMEVKTCWIKRSANSLADGLAKQGAERDSLFWAKL